MKIQFSKALFVPFFALISCNVYANNAPIHHQVPAKVHAAKAKAGNALSDTAITGKIKAKIAMDPSISVFNIDVSTSKGIVMLTGTVNSDTDASALVEIAQATDGVNDVDTSKLSVKNSQQPFSDTVITAKIKGTYIREKLFGNNVPASISVETNNGTVYLSGNVESRQQMHNAIVLAKAVAGVKDVESRLKIIR